MTLDKLGTLRVLLLGCNGQLGIELTRALSRKTELILMDRPSVDLEKPEQIARIIRAISPDVVFNATGYTAVDAAESNPDLALRINAVAPGVIAEEMGRLGGILIHYSTDYVFDGKKSSPYTEQDVPAPLNSYGSSKLEGERSIQRSGCRYLIFRISWMYAPHSTNFYRSISSLARTKPILRIVDDQLGSPTSASAVAEASTGVLQALLCAGDMRSELGLFHMTGSGVVSWCGFARAFLDGLPLNEGESRPQIIGIRSDEFPSPAKRPLNSVLDSSRLFRVFGIRLPSWRKQLAAVIAADPTRNSGQAAARPVDLIPIR